MFSKKWGNYIENGAIGEKIVSFDSCTFSKNEELTRWHQHPRTMEDGSFHEDVSEGDQAMSWDTIDEKYTVMMEKEGGAVPMDVGIVEGVGGEEGEECYEYEWVDAVYPTTRCYFCQGCGHMARECPAKGKGKGGAISGGKGMTKSGIKEAEKEDQKEEAVEQQVGVDAVTMGEELLIVGSALEMPKGDTRRRSLCRGTVVW